VSGEAFLLKDGLGAGSHRGVEFLVVNVEGVRELLQGYEVGEGEGLGGREGGVEGDFVD
jgi:hypothetical protein